jgi:hypothetical protein
MTNFTTATAGNAHPDSLTILTRIPDYSALNPSEDIDHSERHLSWSPLNPLRKIHCSILKQATTKPSRLAPTVIFLTSIQKVSSSNTGRNTD